MDESVSVGRFLWCFFGFSVCVYLRCLRVCLHGKKLKRTQVLEDGRIPEFEY